MKSVLVQFNLQLPAEIKEKGKLFIANYPVLDVCTQGSTLEQAKKNLSEALSLFFISCYERGTLETVLRNCGFHPVINSNQLIDTPQLQMEDYVNVPLPFMIDMNKHAQCHHA
jgi:predicted RNase H-like HicB family nuclease